MVRTLRMRPPPGASSSARGPGDADEDVVQRRPGDLEVLDARPRHQRRQQRLRVPAQPHLLQLPVVVDRWSPPAARRSIAAPPSTRTRTVSAAVGRLDLVERPVEHLLPLEDHEDAVAHPLGHVHVVRAEDEWSCPARRTSSTASLQHFGVDRVEAGERLVEDQQVGLARRPPR